jgi:hypothetical protein
MIGSPLVIAEQARARMNAVLDKLKQGKDIGTSGLIKMRRTLQEADIVITSCEVGPAHGTGTLLLRLFPDSSEIISLRTSNFYDGTQEFGGAQHCLPLTQSSGPEIASWVKWCVAGTRVRRIMVLPYLPPDPLVALATQEITGAPLCTYVMDDKNVCAEGIEDGAMLRLLEQSRLRLVISPEMRDRYAAKYGLDFYVVPPLVPETLLRREPVFPPSGTNPRHGVLLGNVWGQRWLDMLRGCLRGSGYSVDWHCNQKKPAGLSFERSELAKDGIIFHEPVAEAGLPALLARYPFALVPTDALDGFSPPSVRAIAELSLPSRIPTMICMAHLPVLVVGSPATCAARFIGRFGLGDVVPYEQASITDALARLNQPAAQSTIRRRAAALAGRLSTEGSAEWIWQSLAMGRARDRRYEDLMPADVAA